LRGKERGVFVKELEIKGWEGGRAIMFEGKTFKRGEVQEGDRSCSRCDLCVQVCRHEGAVREFVASRFSKVKRHLTSLMRA
jgi:ferredoxin